LAGAECDGGEGGVGDGDGEACLGFEEVVESAQEGAAADERDAVFDDVG